MSFKNKVVLITGGSTGIGAATVQFAKEGANVAIIGRNEARLKEVAQKCEKFGLIAFPIKADVSNDEEANAVIDKTVEKFGKLDVRVNNAAVFKVISLTSANVMETYDDVTRVNINILAAVHLTSLAAAYLIKTKGNIVNVTSIAGQTYAQSPEWMMYALAKAALDHFSRGAALELAAFGVRVNIVSPGTVRTQMLDAVIETKASTTNVDFTVLNRISEPEEVADVIMFLASEKAKGVTGSNYTVDNGTLIKF